MGFVVLGYSFYWNGEGVGVGGGGGEEVDCQSKGGARQMRYLQRYFNTQIKHDKFRYRKGNKGQI